jgi:hypothetical protein
MPRSNTVGFWLDAIPGALGLFGLGELYLGKRLRGEIFLVWTAGLYASVVLAFEFPSLSYYLEIPSGRMGLGYLLLLVDIYRVTRSRSSGPA